ATGTFIEDARWVEATAPADIVQALSAPAAAGQAHAPAPAATERRAYNLNMPQMALGGLSESWLFKELGDVHWSLIASGLGGPSHALQDATGERLYATFTRFELTSTATLSAYLENERIRLDASMSRYGAGLFFSEARATGDHRSLRARLMSSFSKVGE